jgi:hypothetical protein
MTRPLRRAHRMVWIVLSVVLPSLLIAGLAARKETTPANGGLHWDSHE